MERSIPIYNSLFTKYWKEIFNFCNKKLNDKDAAKDVAQNTFIKLWVHLEKMADEKNCKKFIYLCAKHECFNILQTANRRHVIPVEIVSDAFFEEMIMDFDIIEADVFGFMFRCLKELPKRNQATVRLYLKGYNSHQIAEKLGCTEKTALNQKLKAIATLRNKLKLKFGI